MKGPVSRQKAKSGSSVQQGIDKLEREQLLVSPSGIHRVGIAGVT